MMSIGIGELLVIGAILLVVLGLPIVVIVLLVRADRRKKSM